MWTSISNYPPGCSDSISFHNAVVKCPVCGETWSATGYSQLGFWGLVEDEEYECKCGEEGEVIERRGTG